MSIYQGYDSIDSDGESYYHKSKIKKVSKPMQFAFMADYDEFNLHQYKKMPKN